MSRIRKPIQGDPTAAFDKREKREAGVVAADRAELKDTGKFPEGRITGAIRPAP